MKEILKWYCDSLDKNRLIKILKGLDFNIDGFSKKIDKAPLQLIRKKFTNVCVDTPQDKLLFYLCILNEELHDEIVDQDSAEIQEREKELIDKYGVPDYVLGVIAKTEPEEFDNVKDQIKNLIKTGQNFAADDHESKKSEAKEANNLTEKEAKNVRKKLQDKNQQIEKLNRQIEKLKKTAAQIEEKYKKQLGDLSKAYQRQSAELTQAEANNEKMQNEKNLLEQQVSDKDASIKQLMKENEDLISKIREYEINLKIWQAKYPNEKLNNKTLKVIVIGDKPNHDINIVSGIMVDKTIVDFKEAEEICSNNEKNIKSYDLGFLLSSRCTAELRRKILKKFIHCKIKLNEIPNIKNIDSGIQKMVKELSMQEHSIVVND